MNQILNQQGAWWQAEEGMVYAHLGALALRFASYHSARRDSIYEGRWLYGDRVSSYFAGHSSTAATAFPSISPVVQRGALTYNLVRVAADSLAARISQAKPKATFTTDGGTWSQQRRAKRLDDFVYGVFHDVGLYQLGQVSFRDSLLGDLGVLKGYVEGRRIRFERVPPEEIRIDPVEAIYGTPRTLMHTRLVARDVAHEWVDAWHPKSTKEEKRRLHQQVDAAGISTPGQHLLLRDTLGDMVEATEVWRLPSGPEGQGGRHAVCLTHVDLLDELWTLPRFPFAFVRYCQPSLGFYGSGIVDVLRAHQRALNGVLRNISDTIRTMSVSRYWLPDGARFNLDKFGNNEPGLVWRGSQKPEVLSGNVVNPELFRFYRDVISDGLEQVGVSQTWATGQKEAGINSAVALRERMDIQTDRFSLVAQGYEQLYVQCARLVLDLAAKAEADGQPLTATVQRRAGFVRMQWRDAKLDEEHFQLKMDTSNALPMHPAARRQAVRELLEDGAIDTTDYRRLMDMPDLRAHTDLVSAARDVVDALCERFLDGDTGDFDMAEVFRSPEPFDDLQYGIKRMSAEYSRARLAGAPPERLELFQLWMEQARALMAQQPAPGGPEGTPLGPEAAPGGSAPVAA